MEEGLNGAPAESLGFRRDAGETLESMQERKQTEIDHGVVQLESLLNATVDKDFDKFEIYTLRNILALGHEEEALAPWVQLDHYKALDLSRCADAPTPEHVQLQRRKFQETAKLHAMLQAEEARTAAVLSQLRTLVGAPAAAAATPAPSASAPAAPFAFLHRAQIPARPPLASSVEYAVGQLPALRRLLAELQASLRTLPGARPARAEGDSSTAEQRGRYVEQQSLRALERRGVARASREGADAGVGRRVRRDEIEGLEAVVQALGGADSAGATAGDEAHE